MQFIPLSIAMSFSSWKKRMGAIYLALAIIPYLSGGHTGNWLAGENIVHELKLVAIYLSIYKVPIPLDWNLCPEINYNDK